MWKDLNDIMMSQFLVLLWKDFFTLGFNVSTFQCRKCINELLLKSKFVCVCIPGMVILNNQTWTKRFKRSSGVVLF